MEARHESGGNEWRERHYDRAAFLRLARDLHGGTAASMPLSGGEIELVKMLPNPTKVASWLHSAAPHVCLPRIRLQRASTNRCASNEGEEAVTWDVPTYAAASWSAATHWCLARAAKCLTGRRSSS